MDCACLNTHRVSAASQHGLVDQRTTRQSPETWLHLLDDQVLMEPEVESNEAHHWWNIGDP